MKKEQVTFKNGNVLENYKPYFKKSSSTRARAIKAFYKTVTEVSMLEYVMQGGTVEDYQKIKAAELDEKNSKTAND